MTVIASQLYYTLRVHQPESVAPPSAPLAPSASATLPPPATVPVTAALPSPPSFHHLGIDQSAQCVSPQLPPLCHCQPRRHPRRHHPLLPSFSSSNPFASLVNDDGEDDASDDVQRAATPISPPSPSAGPLTAASPKPLSPLAHEAMEVKEVDVSKDGHRISTPLHIARPSSETVPPPSAPAHLPPPATTSTTAASPSPPSSSPPLCQPEAERSCSPTPPAPCCHCSHCHLSIPFAPLVDDAGEDDATEDVQRAPIHYLQRVLVICRDRPLRRLSQSGCEGD